MVCFRSGRQEAARRLSPGECSVKVRVKVEMCEGHGKCEKAAPEIFKVGDDDVSVVLIEGDLPKELEEKAERAYRLCPRQAIELIS